MQFVFTVGSPPPSVTWWYLGENEAEGKSLAREPGFPLQTSSHMKEIDVDGTKIAHMDLEHVLSERLETKLRENRVTPIQLPMGFDGANDLPNNPYKAPYDMGQRNKSRHSKKTEHQHASINPKDYILVDRYMGRLIDSSWDVLQTGTVRNELQLKSIDRDSLLARITCLASNSNLTAPLKSTVTIDINRKYHSRPLKL